MRDLRQAVYLSVRPVRDVLYLQRRRPVCGGVGGGEGGREGTEMKATPRQLVLAYAAGLAVFIATLMLMGLFINAVGYAFFGD
jgi:hypothetical protein